MPRKTTNPRKGAGQTPAPRPDRRKANPKQAKGPSDLARHGRHARQSVRPMKFPGRLGGR